MTIWILVVLPFSIVGYAPDEQTCRSRGLEIARAIAEVQHQTIEILCKPAEEIGDD